MSLPEEIELFCVKEFGALSSFQAASGGCINHGGRLSTASGDVFLKWNSSSRFPEMFAKEARGLKILSAPGYLTVPKVIACYEGEQHACLVLEYLESAAPVKNYWETLGSGLAGIHCVTSDRYGLDHSNYIGSLVQNNDYHHNWVEFLVRCRLQPQVKLAFDHGKMRQDHVQLFELLYARLEDLLTTEPAALIHGDLWSGNIMTDHSGKPALIDPAVSFANREMDIALMRLFGMPSDGFYEAYNEAFPLEPDWQGRIDLYNLYPLLIHVNLFGGGYLHQTMSIVRKHVG